MNKLLVILGPTATGKTDLALRLASPLDKLGTNPEYNRMGSLAQGELVSCDSRQVYRGLDIGTGKMSNVKSQMSNVKKRKGFWEVDGVKIWMYDVVDPKVQYTVADYVKDANKVIRDIRKRGKLPIVVGGTGLYLKALLEGLPNLSFPINRQLRKKLEKLSKNALQKKIQEISPDKWESLNVSDRQNPRRLIRAIELYTVHMTGRSPRSLSLARDDILKIGLIAPRDVLYHRVDVSLVNRINQGMIEEANRLHKSGLSFKRMKQLGLEYGVLADFMQDSISKGELIKVMQRKIHGYVRRQLTWFKKPFDTAQGKGKGVYWFDITDKEFPANLEKKVSAWYHRA